MSSHAGSQPTSPLAPDHLTDDEEALSLSEHSHDGSPSSTNLEPLYNLTLHLHNRPIELPIYDSSATIQDLSDTIAEDMHIPPSHQKFFITPKTGLLKPPFKDPSILISTLRDKKIVLMGATTAEVAELESDISDRKARIEKRKAAMQAGRKVRANRNRDWKKVQDEAQYTFHTIRPLEYLPNPEKSLRFLERLRDDAGIKTSMRKHGFSVGLLTEMNPAEHTTHQSRTLGLNRNRGEVIELRLRTDAYDGYRDYKVIRKTLCHELTHNVWGDHDQRFWKLCKEIEAEVERNDWRRGGKSVGGEEFYNPNDDGESDDHECDGGGWEEGEFTLGGVGGSGSVSSLSRREIMARAAEERMKKSREAKAEEQQAKEAK
ncbi:ubiquitin/metalloprotease fusion protein [Zymoseptoria brevis]|uniref:Ubiquitin/metalloprotease fusion protein n=1 Tax=Zymoseptoria brevis TaxID=1047168 RepID=A0A0F4GPW4_9PEZI|nr:ubiquitin/metalloprotease fusion protein [Zymoseptoria brevis]